MVPSLFAHGFSEYYAVYTRVSMEVSNYLGPGSWFITYLGDLQPIYIYIYRGYNPFTK